MKPLFSGSALELTKVTSELVIQLEEPKVPPATDGIDPLEASEPTIIQTDTSEVPLKTLQGQSSPETFEFEMGYPPGSLELKPAPSPSELTDRSILLSRTLTGLIDFIIVLFSSIPFFFTLVYSSGYDEMDSFTLLILLGVWICIYHLYSVFFLAFSGQTIGMMITNLQVVTSHGGLPGYGRVFCRVTGFMLAVALGGLGLGWGLLDSKNRCLQDWISKTQVIRIGSPGPL